MEEKLNQKKNVVWNMIGATANAFNSFLFTIIVTRINGLNDAGIFTYAFATACLLYVIGIYEGRAFQVTDISDKYTDSDYIYNRIFTCIIMIFVAVVFCIIRGYDLYKSSIIILLSIFKCIESFSEIIYGVIQKNHRLYQTGISLTIKAFCDVLIFIVVDFITKNLILSCISIILVNIVVLIIYDYKNMRKCKMKKSKYSNTKNLGLIKAGFFTFIFTFLGLYLVNASRYSIDSLLTNDFQTIFGIIIMPATFMSLLAQYIISPVLTKIATTIKEQSYQNLRNIVITLSGLILGTGLIILIVAYLLESPVLSFIYGVDLSAYLLDMIVIVFGSIAYSLVSILSAILISLRKTRGQAVIYGIVSIFTCVFSYIMVKNFNINGASFAYCITMIILSICFIIYTIYNLHKFKKKWQISLEEKCNE